MVCLLLPVNGYVDFTIPPSITPRSSYNRRNIDHAPSMSLLSISVFQSVLTRFMYEDRSSDFSYGSFATIEVLNPFNLLSYGSFTRIGILIFPMVVSQGSRLSILLVFPPTVLYSRIEGFTLPTVLFKDRSSKASSSDSFGSYLWIETVFHIFSTKLNYSFLTLRAGKTEVKISAWELFLRAHGAGVEETESSQEKT